MEPDSTPSKLEDAIALAKLKLLHALLYFVDRKQSVPVSHIAKAFADLSLSAMTATPIVAEFGTTLDVGSREQLEALSAFYNGVRHALDLPGTRDDEPYSTPERIRETLDKLGQLQERLEASAEEHDAFDILSSHDALSSTRRVGGPLNAIIRRSLDELLAWQQGRRHTPSTIAETVTLQRIDDALRDAHKALYGNTSPVLTIADETKAREHYATVPEPQHEVFLAHARRLAMLRRILATAEYGAHLRNELDAANHEVAELRAELAAAKEEHLALVNILHEADGSEERTAVELANALVARDKKLGNILAMLRGQPVSFALGVDADLDSFYQAILYRHSIAKYQQEIDSLRSQLAAKNEAWSHVIGSLNRLPLDHDQRPSTGSLVDVVETVVRLVDERATLATRADLASKLFANCRELIAFWRVGSEAFKMAANNLDTMLVRTIGTDYEAFTIAARAAQTAEAKTGAVRKAYDVTMPIGVAAQKIEKGTLVSIDLPSGHVKPMDSGSVSAMDPMTTPKTEAEMPHVFECGCSKFKVLAGMCDVFDEFGRDRSKLAT